ncbi:hypothetical protein ACVGOW_11185 [Pseudonocardia saturnea]
MAVEPVRVTDAGAWFRPSDGGAGSLLRLADGVPEEAVRRVRDLRVAGLLPIGNVVLRDGGVWLRTPQPPGPTLADLLSGPSQLGTDDAVAVIGTVGRVLRAVHARGMCHGAVGGDAVLLDPDGAPLLVMVAPGPITADCDAAALAALARVVAAAWCDADGTECLSRFADLAEDHGTLDAAIAALPRAAPPGPARRERARVWGAAGPC